jgi:hypothetical protein
MVMTFDESAKQNMLSIFGFGVKDGYLINKSSGKKALTCDGKEIKLEEVGAISRGNSGELNIIKRDLVSIIQVSDKMNEINNKNNYSVNNTKNYL